MESGKPGGLRVALRHWEPGGLSLGLGGVGGKGRSRRSPKQTPSVCLDQHDSTAVTKLTHPQLVLQRRVGKDHHL